MNTVKGFRVQGLLKIHLAPDPDKVPFRLSFVNPHIVDGPPQCPHVPCHLLTLEDLHPPVVKSTNIQEA